MNKKIEDLIKEKAIVIPLSLYKLRNKLDIDLEAYVFLMYLKTIGNRALFDVNYIANDFGADVGIIMAYISKLQDKKLISIEVTKNDKNITEEYISLDFFYSKLTALLLEDINKNEERDEETVYDIVEKAFGRTLSPIEYEIVKAWCDSQYSEELIKEAVKEAVFNGVSNLRYIDKILYEWNKKGFKGKEDVEKNRVAHKENVTKADVFDYDWMDDES